MIVDDAFVPQPSVMGLAVRVDGGEWEPRPQFPAVQPIRELMGDPWLATDVSHSVVYYVGMARVIDPALPDAIAITRSEDGGRTWGPLLRPGLTVAGDVSFFAPGLSIDKPSVAVRGGATLHVAYRLGDVGATIQVGRCERRPAAAACRRHAGRAPFRRKHFGDYIAVAPFALAPDARNVERFRERFGLTECTDVSTYSALCVGM